MTVKAKRPVRRPDPHEVPSAAAVEAARKAIEAGGGPRRRCRRKVAHQTAGPTRRRAASPFRALVAVRAAPADAARVLPPEVLAAASGQDDCWPLAGRLRRLLADRGYRSVRQLHLATGIRWSTLSRIFGGKVTPRPRTLERILAALGTDTRSFYGE
jgi:hypothetical protein